MSPCDLLERFLDGALLAEQQTFEAHLSMCPKCQPEVARFEQLAQQASAWAHPRGVPEPTLAKRSLLVRRAYERAGARSRGPLWVLAAGGVLAAAMVTFVVVRRPSLPLAAPPQVELALTRGASHEVIHSTEVVGSLIEAREPVVATLGRDRFGLSAGSRVRVVKVSATLTRLSVETGRIAVEVDPRRGSGAFEVEAGEVLVRVVGTRFFVSREEGRRFVAVAHGTVIVRQGRSEWTLNAGQQLPLEGPTPTVTQLSGAVADELDATLQGSVIDAGRSGPLPTAQQPPVEPKPHEAPGTDDVEPDPVAPALAPRVPNASSLAQWRKWVVEGRYDDADEALGKHLKKHPLDVEALSLFSTLQRKRQDFAGAVTTSRKIIATGDAASANRARFQAASLLQDQLGDAAGAARLLEAYVKQGKPFKPLEAAAMVRLGRALKSLGRAPEATKWLERVVSGYPNTPEATEADHLLNPTP